MESIITGWKSATNSPHSVVAIDNKCPSAWWYDICKEYEHQDFTIIVVSYSE